MDIFHAAIKEKKYTCFLQEDTVLPMMYMPDALKATIGIMEAPLENVRIRSSYNLAAFSFSPAELAEEIKAVVPGFTISYKVDFRQKIAEGWPRIIDDSRARKDWNWSNDFDLPAMVKNMVENLLPILQK